MAEPPWRGFPPHSKRTVAPEPIETGGRGTDADVAVPVESASASAPRAAARSSGDKMDPVSRVSYATTPKRGPNHVPPQSSAEEPATPSRRKRESESGPLVANPAALVDDSAPTWVPVGTPTTPTRRAGSSGFPGAQGGGGGAAPGPGRRGSGNQLVPPANGGAGAGGAERKRSGSVCGGPALPRPSSTDALGGASQIRNALRLTAGGGGGGEGGGGADRPITPSRESNAPRSIFGVDTGGALPLPELPVEHEQSVRGQRLHEALLEQRAYAELGHAAESLERAQRLIIRPDHPMKRLWDAVVIGFALFAGLYSPFDASYPYEQDDHGPWLDRSTFRVPLNVTQWTGDAVFMLDLLFTFNVGYMSYGAVETRRSEIARHYASRTLLVDLLGIPTPLILLLAGAYPEFTLLRIFRLVRFERLGDLVSTGPLPTRILALLVCWAWWAHFVACIWHLLAATRSGWGSSNWLDAFSVPRETTTEYVESLYWAFATMTPMGYAGIFAISNAEKMYTICVQMTGAVMYAAVFGTITASINTRDRIEAEHTQRLQRVDKFAHAYGLDSELSKKIASYTASLYNLNRGIDPHEIVGKMPEAVQQDVYMQVYLPFLEHVPVFANSSVDFLNVVVRRLRPQVCLKGDFIFRKGAMPTAMYFVQRGIFALVAERRKQARRRSYFRSGAALPVLDGVQVGASKSLSWRSKLRSQRQRGSLGGFGFGLRASGGGAGAMGGGKEEQGGSAGAGGGGVGGVGGGLAAAAGPEAEVDPNAPLVISTLYPGASFGEIAMLTQCHHLYSVQALADGVLFLCTTKDFQEVARKFPDFVNRVKKRALRELQAHATARDKTQHQGKDTAALEADTAQLWKQVKTAAAELAGEGADGGAGAAAGGVAAPATPGAATPPLRPLSAVTSDAAAVTAAASVAVAGRQWKRISKRTGAGSTSGAETEVVVEGATPGASPVFSPIGGAELDAIASLPPTAAAAAAAAATATGGGALRFRNSKNSEFQKSGSAATVLSAASGDAAGAGGARAPPSVEQRLLMEGSASGAATPQLIDPTAAAAICDLSSCAFVRQQLLEAEAAAAAGGGGGGACAVGRQASAGAAPGAGSGVGSCASSFSGSRFRRAPGGGAQPSPLAAPPPRAAADGTATAAAAAAGGVADSVEDALRRAEARAAATAQDAERIAVEARASHLELLAIARAIGGPAAVPPAAEAAAAAGVAAASTADSFGAGAAAPAPPAAAAQTRVSAAASRQAAARLVDGTDEPGVRRQTSAKSANGANGSSDNESAGDADVVIVDSVETLGTAPLPAGRRSRAPAADEPDEPVVRRPVLDI